jgi:serine/threonine protein kinase
LEWLEGQTLEERLTAGPLGLNQTVQLAVRVLEALAFAHGQGVVHRDLKPSNLFLPGGSLAQLKLLDFGIARRIDARRLTRTGTTIGTPMYMSPEQARGERTLDPRSDLFSLAAILIECLTGVSPFASETYVAMMMKICFEPVDVGAACGDAPPQLVELLTRMLGKRPEERPADTARLATELSKVADRLAQTGFATTVEQVVFVPPPARALLTAEQRILSAIVLWPTPTPTALKDTRDEADVDQAVADSLADLGARVDRLGGTFLITLLGRGTPADQAIQAALCAEVAGAAATSGLRRQHRSGHGGR